MVGSALAVNLTTALEQLVFHRFELVLSFSNSMAHISITALSALELLLNVIDFRSNTVVLSSKIAIVTSDFLVDVTGVGKISLAFFKCVVLAAKVMVELLDKAAKVFKTGFHSLDFCVQMRKFICLVICFVGLLVTDLL